MPRNDLLRQRRIERNWRQQDVADHLGIAVITIQRWERGSQQPSAYYRVKLCALFGLSAQELGLVEDAPPPVQDEPAAVAPPEPASGVSLWTVPFARNPHFTGRDELLDLLTQHFPPQEDTIRHAALTQPQALQGLGGIGKTQLAVEYAYRSRELGRYTHTLWIAAASEEAVLSSFVALANLLPAFPARGETDQRTLVTTVINWLEQQTQPWLLIMDNADDLTMIRPYLPRRGNGNILLTTRAHAVGSLAIAVEVNAMSVIEGANLLLQRAHRLAHASDEEINEASNLVIALAQFPLALDQAGAYIEETGCGVRDYLEIYQQHRITLLARRGRQATGYPESVTTTWSLSFQQVERVNPVAADLLRLCAFLAPDHIPEELLTEGAPYWPPALQQAASDSFSFNEMLEPLLSFSLVKRLSDEHLLSIHRLVQVVQLERIRPEERQHWAERVIRAFNAVFPADPKNDIESWSQCQRYLEQAQGCDALIQEYQLLLPEGAAVLERTGIYLRERILYPLAEPLFQQALRIREQVLGAEHSATAQTLNNLALLYYKQGRYAEAEPLYLRALHIFEPEQLEVSYPVYGLANLYYQQEKYREAEALFLRALQIREQQLGPEHPEVAYPIKALALLYYKQGRYSESEPLYLRALHIFEQQPQLSPLDIANLLTSLGLLYYKQGRYAEAEPLYLRALRIREQMTANPDHPDIVYLLNDLALLYRTQGRYEQAEPLYQWALRISEQQVGPEHLLIAHPLNGLAYIYREQGKFEQAEPLYQWALRIREQQLGPEHSQVAYPLNGLATLYREQGRFEQAEQLYQRVLRIRERQQGPEHLEVSDVLNDLAALRQKQDRLSEAIALYQRALRIREKIFGPEHPLTIEIQQRLQAASAPG